MDLVRQCYDEELANVKQDKESIRIKVEQDKVLAKATMKLLALAHTANYCRKGWRVGRYQKGKIPRQIDEDSCSREGHMNRKIHQINLAYKSRMESNQDMDGSDPDDPEEWEEDFDKDSERVDSDDAYDAYDA